MLASLTLATIVYAFGLAACCAWFAVAGHARPLPVTASVALVQTVLVVLVVADTVRALDVQHGAALATNLGYAAALLVALPAVAVTVRLDDDRWGSAAFAVGCVLVAVLALRMNQTLGAHGG